MNRIPVFLIAFVVCCNSVFAPTVVAQAVRRIPPEGIAISDNDRDELGVGLLQLGKDIEALKQRKDPFITALLPDVMIYYKAVDYALKYQEFFAPKDIISGKKILQEGLARANALKDKKAPWATQKGEVVRGYISRIDGSVQPYGVTVPDNYQANGPAFDLSLWFHGRGETLSEVNFIADGKGFSGSMPAMKNTIMLYPYGRYCNAFKFAGEVDVLEALADAKKKYKINDNGLFDRGFSMGGAAAWQFAVHYPDMWLAANPGAGFAETANFMDKFGHEILHPTETERMLWHLYDCTDYASNLSNLPIYAYNGDKDPQKQAADTMAGAMKREGLKLNRIWGIDMGHGYTKAAAKTVDSLLAIDQAKGKNPPPAEIHFTTYTLKYNSMYWLTVDRVFGQWEIARVDAKIHQDTIHLKTNGVAAFSLVLSKMPIPFKKGQILVVHIDTSVFKIKITRANDSLKFYHNLFKWITGPTKPLWMDGIVKKHNLQGPIDDAFMSAFIVVKPSGSSTSILFDKWSKNEMNRFIEQWRTQFRGDPIVKMDTDITEADMRSNLIAFGDAQSNKYIAKVKDKLAIKLNDTAIIWVYNRKIPTKDNGLIEICPNPQNPEHYLVLNSGFTFREESYLNNSKQIPMLPDWAIIDLHSSPDNVYPGKIRSSGFFDDVWSLNIPHVE